MKNGSVTVPSSEYTVSWADETVTVTAATDSKYYTGSQTVDRDIIAAPGNTVLSVTGRTTSTVSLAWEEVEGAEGYTIWFRSEYDTKMSRKIIQGGDVTSWTQTGYSLVLNTSTQCVHGYRMTKASMYSVKSSLRHSAVPPNRLQQGSLL